jgi:hypothetical protein
MQKIHLNIPGRRGTPFISDPPPPPPIERKKKNHKNNLLYRNTQS